jgi:hypothetical protein
MKRTRAFFLADAVVGLTLIGLIAGMLAVAFHTQQVVMLRLADDRNATNLARATLAAMEQGQRPPTDPRVEISPISAVAGRNWVRIQATANGRTEQLIALVPKEVSP